MKEPDFKKLARNITHDILGSKEDLINLEEFCNKRLRKECKKLSDLEIAENLSPLIEGVKRQVNHDTETRNSKNLPPNYEFATYPPNTLIKYDLSHRDGYSHIREYSDDILKAVVCMDWRKFEYLCKHLLKVNNIVISNVTSGKKDGGIDFYGVLEMNRFSPQGVLLKDMKIRILGQAKRYQNAVEDDKLRVFQSHCKDLVEQKGRAIPKMPDWFVKSKDPLLPIFVITTKFTRGAEKFAKEEGIILIEGKQVVEDIIKSPKSREWFSRKKGKLVFDKKLFFGFFEEEWDYS